MNEKLDLPQADFRPCVHGTLGVGVDLQIALSKKDSVIPTQIDWPACARANEI